MSDTLTKVLELRKRIESLERKVAMAEGEQIQIMKELAESFQIKTIPEGHKKLKQMTARRKELIRMRDCKLATFMKKWEDKLP